MEMDDYVKAVKQYGKIDGDDEDSLIASEIDAAKETLRRTGIPEQSENALYALAAVRLALHYHENREEIGVGGKMPMGIDWMIEHLRHGDDE